MLAVIEILVKVAVMITGTKIISLGGQAPSLLSNFKTFCTSPRVHIPLQAQEDYLYSIGLPYTPGIPKNLRILHINKNYSAL